MQSVVRMQKSPIRQTYSIEVVWKFVYVINAKALDLHNPCNTRYVGRESKLIRFIGAQELGLAPESQSGRLYVTEANVLDTSSSGRSVGLGFLP
jgi:hypothetical protein